MITARHPRPDGQQRRSYGALVGVAFVGLPVFVTLYVLFVGFHHLNALGPDFGREFWPAAHRVADGLSPYKRGWMDINGGVAFPYPALTALVFVPWVLLPHALADGLFVVLNIAAVLMTLRVLNVTDRRVYGVALVWPVIVEAWMSGNLTIALALGIALLWRKRDNPIIAGVLLATLVSLKPFVWPLGLWLLATRRYAALGYGVLAGLVMNIVAWAVLGFNQFHAYNSIVHAVTNAMWRRGYEPAAVALHLGAGAELAYVIGTTIAIAVAIACIRAGYRRDDRSALALSIALTLVATPVLWNHYFALMIVPLALARPRLDWTWFLPLTMWVCPVNPLPWQAFVALGVTAVLVVACIRRSDVKAGSADRAPSGGHAEDRGAIQVLRAEPRPS